jgi:hypothetical protein
MQSGYHNLPQINGLDQCNGKDYRTSVVSCSKTSLTLELAGAYPAEACVDSWQRTVSLYKKEVRVKEHYQLQAQKAPTRLMLMTTVQPDVSRPGIVRLGGRSLSYDPKQLSAAVEDVSPQLDALLKGMWGDRLYRIVLTLRSQRLTDTVVYKIY